MCECLIILDGKTSNLNSSYGKREFKIASNDQRNVIPEEEVKQNCSSNDAEENETFDAGQEVTQPMQYVTHLEEL